MSEDNGSMKELNVDFDLPINRTAAVWEMYMTFKSYKFSQRQTLMFLKLISTELENEKALELIQKIVMAARKQTPLSLADEDNIKNQVSELILEFDNSN